MNNKQRKLAVALFRDAANRIAENYTEFESSNGHKVLGCCAALSDAYWAVRPVGGYNFSFDASRFFRGLFKPDTLSSYWWENPWGSDEDQQTRIFALLFAADMVESGLDIADINV